MIVHNLHSWEVSIQDAPSLQKQLAKKVRLTGGKKTPKIVAGADISMNKHSPHAYAGVILLEFPSLKVLDSFTAEGELRFPYIPGLLSFREAPILLDLFKKVRPDPDLIFFDGHGLAHPRRLGLACHMGLFLDCPAIGCAKTRLVGEYDDPLPEKGASSWLHDKNGTVLGAALRSKDNCKPIFVSPGNRIDLDTTVQRTLQCTSRYRIPEPTRLAHNLVNEIRKKALTD